MFHGFPGLLADPASPLEVLLFVAAVAATTAGVAALLYVAVLSALWASSGRRVVGFWALFFPGRSQVRKHVADAFLWTLTAGIVVLTLVVRSELVHQIEDYPLGGVVSKVSVDRAADECRLEGEKADLVARLFPLGEMSPDLCEALEGTLQSGASALLGPVVEMGRSAAARVLVEEISRRVASEPRGLARYVSERNLRWLCLAALLAYVLWTARDRFVDLRADARSQPSYGEITRRLLTLAVCLALLLVAVPRLVGDTTLLADGVLASLERRALSGQESHEPLATKVREAILEQNRLPRLLQGPGRNGQPNVWAEIGQVRAEGEVAAGRLHDLLNELDGRLAAAVASLAAANDAIAARQSETEALKGEAEAVRSDLDALRQRNEQALAELRQEQAQLAARLKETVDQTAQSLKRLAQESSGRLARLEARLPGIEAAIDELRQGTPKTGTLIIFAAYTGQPYLFDGQRGGLAPAVRSVVPGVHRVGDVRTDSVQEVSVGPGEVAGVALPVPPPG